MRRRDGLRHVPGPNRRSDRRGKLGRGARFQLVPGRNPRTLPSMQGDERVIEFLNEQLTAELTAINQYFLHAKMQENWGYTKLAKFTKHESIDEMKHAEVLTDRILFLDGLPNYQRLFALRIGESVPEQFKCDMQVELEAVDRLRRGIEYMRSVGDITSANIFEGIL